MGRFHIMTSLCGQSRWAQSFLHPPHAPTGSIAGGQIRYSAHVPAPLQTTKNSVDVRGRLSLSVNLPPALSDSPSAGHESPALLLDFNATNHSTILHGALNYSQPHLAAHRRGSMSGTLIWFVEGGDELPGARAPPSSQSRSRRW